MKEDFLGQFGPEISSGNRATNGGKQDPKPLPYDPPKGPTEQMRQKPGLGGTNHGNCGTQGRR